MDKFSGWELRVAGIVGCLVMLACGVSLVLGRDARAVVALACVAAPLAYALAGLSIAKIKARDVEVIFMGRTEEKPSQPGRAKPPSPKD